MNAQDILKISNPEKLFGESVDGAKAAFRMLVSKWHPDHCSDPMSSQVLAHITALRDKLRRGETGNFSWLTLRWAGGHEFRMKSLRQSRTNLGLRIISPASMSMSWNPGFEDLAKAESLAIEGFRFADGGMEREMRRYLPELAKSEALDGGWISTVKRKSSDICLADILDRVGPMPPVHAAWLTSGLLNIACWLDWAGLVHGAISPENIVIDPTTHEVKLYGGWCFASSAGTRPAALPGTTLNAIPRLAIPGETVNASVDLELIRKTVLAALGDPFGMALEANGVSAGFRKWLLMAPAPRAIEDFRSWNKALDADWGKRAFTVYDVSSEEVYK